ncbi:MAG: hypothetical protein N3A58_01815 [Spirochaetes bacterium]|nr:hypothetical protein [Spirochaetota bacterium]
MAKISYKSCCLNKLHKFIYQQNTNSYNFVECCNLTYYVLPYKNENLSIVFIRENSEQDYYFLSKDSKLYKVFNIIDKKEEREIKIKEFLEKNKNIF